MQGTSREEVCATSLAERYKQLRHRALAGEPDGSRLGLAVFMRQGMTAWMRTWRELPAPARIPGPSPGRGDDAIVAALARMALSLAGGTEP